MEEKAENRTACRAKVDEDPFSVAAVAGIYSCGKNCSENEASNWTPGGHIRARGDRRGDGERGTTRERRRRWRSGSGRRWKEKEGLRE